MLSAVLLSLVLASCGGHRVGVDEGLGVLLVSSAASTSSIEELDGAEISGIVHIVVDVNPSVSEVWFFLDDEPESRKIDREPPFELELDTRELSDGQHLLVASTPSAGGKRLRELASASFTVVNDGAPAPDPDPEPAPQPDPEPGDDLVFVGEGGKVVVFAERSPAEAWTTDSALSGFTGSSYYLWSGAPQPVPGTSVLRYRFEVDESGLYCVRLRLLAGDGGNDVWARLDDGPWFRVNTHRRGEWTFDTVIEVDGSNTQWFEGLEPGVTYALEVAALGSGVALDQVRVWRHGLVGLHDAGEPESTFVGAEPSEPGPTPDPDPEPDPDPGSGPSPEYDHLHQIHVNPSHAAAADTNAGTETEPLATMRAGLDRAFAMRRDESKGSRVLLYPGIYRESIDTVYPNEGDALIVIESLVPRQAIMSGSDVWTDWSCSSGVCTHHWPFEWGVAENPWPNNVEIGPLARRQEIVFVNGQNLDQHLSLAELTPGSFYVDEDADTIFLRPPTGVSLTSATVEVGVRGQLLRAQALHHVVLKGLVFQHSASPFRRSAVDIVDQRHVLLEDCEIRWNGQGGLSLLGHDLTVRNCTMNDNGGSGVTATRSTNLVLEDTETSFNNWRGYRVGYMTWAVGHKFSRTHGLTITRHRSVGNFTRGLWLDTDVKHAVLDGLELCGNAKDGVFLEALQGPITLRNSIICDNIDAGILGGTVVGLTLEGNRIEGNLGDQVRISGTSNRKIDDWRTGEVLTLVNEHWTVRSNALSGVASQLLYETTLPLEHWEHLMATSSFDANSYVQPDATRVFRVGGGGLVTFPTWQERLGDEAHSTFGQ